MKILASVCSFEDRAAVRRCVEALLDQTHRPGEILIVDNRSSEAQAPEERDLRAEVNLICHRRNLGPAGAAATALEYALSRGYDWLWVFDQDSVPRPDALAEMVRLLESFTPERRERIGLVGCLVVLDPERELSFAQFLDRGGARQVRIDGSRDFWECDTTIWSGSLYSLAAVGNVGLPRFGREGFWQDFSMDFGDLEFGFRIKCAGYEVLIQPRSFLEHRFGSLTRVERFHRSVPISHHPPFRRYLSVRNMVYFWLYLHPTRRLPLILVYLFSILAKGILVTLLMEEEPAPKLGAVLRGAKDGLLKNLDRRY